MKLSDITKNPKTFVAYIAEIIDGEISPVAAGEDADVYGYITIADADDENVNREYVMRKGKAVEQILTQQFGRPYAVDNNLVLVWRVYNYAILFSHWDAAHLSIDDVEVAVVDIKFDDYSYLENK